MMFQPAIPALSVLTEPEIPGTVVRIPALQVPQTPQTPGTAETPETPETPEAPEAPEAPERPSGVTVQSDDGRTISVGSDGIVITNASTGTQSGAREATLPESVMVIVFGFFAMLVLLILGIPIVRAFIRRMNRAPVVPMVAQAQREQVRALGESVDRLAVEVERVSEGQRWLERRLAGTGDRSAAGHD